MTAATSPDESQSSPPEPVAETAAAPRRTPPQDAAGKQPPAGGDKANATRSEDGADRIPAPAKSISALGVALVGLAAALRPLRDFDLPWNLATGRIICATGSIPTVDDLAFTNGQLRYVEVLGDTFLYLVHQVVGPLGLQLVGMLVAVGLLGCTYGLLRRRGPVAFVAVAVVAATVVPWLHVRPATISFLFLRALLWLLRLHRERPEAWWWAALVIPLQLVWANVHGFVALSNALVLAYLGHRILSHWAAGRLGRLLPQSDGSQLATSASLLLAAVGASCINTAGPALLLGPFRFDERLSDITEWARPSLSYFVDQEPVAAILVGLAAVSFLLGREPDGTRVPPLFDALLAALACAALFVAVRLLPLALVLLVPMAARRLAVWVRSTPVVAYVLGTAPLAAGGWLLLSLPLSTTPGFDRTWLPVAAVDFVESKEVRGHMYNFSPFGGYLAWRLHPRHRVFMDGRNQLARPAELVVRAARARGERAAFRKLVDDYDMQWAVVRSAPGEELDAPIAASSRWTMIYLDDVAAVYVRGEGPNAHLTADGYRIIRHLSQPHTVIEAARNRPALASALAHDGRLAAQQAPSSPRAAFFEAAGGIAARDWTLFEQGEGQLRRLQPTHAALGILRQVARERGYSKL